MIDRIGYIMDALEINETKANIINGTIKDIPDDKLPDFFIFRMKFLEPYKSADVATKEAVSDFQRISIRARLKAGDRIFSTPEAVRHHLETFYRGRDIVNGPGRFFDYVVIAMNKDGEMVNKYKINEHGGFTRLNGEDVADVLQWLFIHQDRIGDVKIIQERETALSLDSIKAPDYIPAQGRVSGVVQNAIDHAYKKACQNADNRLESEKRG
jgi:hypothetical protein